MNRPKLANPYKCTGCLACVDSCPQDALSKEIREDGHIYVECDTSRCVLCRKCEKVCPVMSNYKYQTTDTPYYFAAWCKNICVRKLSASGGAFAAMAMYVLNVGGYVVGAANVGVCEIRHIVIDTVDDLYKLQGSKYSQSDVSRVYSRVKKILKEGKTVLFSGTGCQIAGLLSFMGSQPYEGKLITVDLICGGVPSKLLINSFIKNEPYNVKKIIAFRTKDSGWKSKGFLYNLKVEDCFGQLHDYTGIKNLVTNGFCSELTNRYSCYDCQYCGVSRKCNFTIGDCWGDTQFVDQHYEGLSVIIAHGEESLGLLEKMEDYLKINCISGDDVATCNPRLVNGKMKGVSYFERRYISSLFGKLSYSALKKIYGNEIPIYSPWIIYKIYRKLRILF